MPPVRLPDKKRNRAGMGVPSAGSMLQDLSGGDGQASPSALLEERAARERRRLLGSKFKRTVTAVKVARYMHTTRRCGRPMFRRLAHVSALTLVRCGLHVLGACVPCVAV